MGLGMIYGKPLDTDGIEDRAYRLRYNEGQIRTDFFGQVCQAQLIMYPLPCQPHVNILQDTSHLPPATCTHT